MGEREGLTDECGTAAGSIGSGRTADGSEGGPGAAGGISRRGLGTQQQGRIYEKYIDIIISIRYSLKEKLGYRDFSQELPLGTPYFEALRSRAIEFTVKFPSLGKTKSSSATPFRILSGRLPTRKGGISYCGASD